MAVQDPNQAIVILTVGIILMQGLWLSFLTYMMWKREEERQKEEEPARGPAAKETVIEDVFLLDRGGRLLRHLTRRLKPYADGDILAGMLRAVQEFVRDAFAAGEGEEAGELNEVSFGELRISICSGQHLILASVVRGKSPEDILGEMRAALHDLEADHGDDLARWDGNLDEVGFVDDYLERLLEGEYRAASRKELLPAAP